MRGFALCLSSLLAAQVLAQAPSVWMDTSSHTAHVVQVEPGTSVEVLDRGGSGHTLVLLTQLGQTAHIYDEWAPKLARAYRVVGVTRRGYGESTLAVDAAMSTERLGRDIVAVLDTLKLPRAVLVGHGFAGEELSWVGSNRASSVAGLIYIDAAYDRTRIGEEGAIARRIPVTNQMRPEDMASAASLTRWMSAGLGFPIPEAEVRQVARFGPDGRVVGERAAPIVQQRALAGMVPNDYASIRVPTLAIYAKRGPIDVSPGCRMPPSDAVRQACSELFEWTVQQRARSEALVRTIRARTEVVDLPGHSAFVFFPYEREITQAIDRFVGGLPQ
jgi:non-heme chloroperoxidase